MHARYSWIVASAIFALTLAAGNVGPVSGKPLETISGGAAGLKPLLYVADANEGAVDVYEAGVRRPKLLAKLSTGKYSAPLAISVDRYGHLYAVTDVPSESILEFARGKTVPFRTISIPGVLYVLDMSVADDGAIYLVAAGSSGNDDVTQLNQAGTVIRSIVFPNNVYPSTAVTDPAGNLYVAVYESSSYDVLVYAPGSTTPMADIKQPASAGGLALDSKGHLLVGAAPSDSVFVEALPSGKVLRKITTVGAGDFLAYDAPDNYLYAVSQYGGTVQWYDYASGRQLGFLTGRSGEVAVDSGIRPL